MILLSTPSNFAFQSNFTLHALSNVPDDVSRARRNAFAPTWPKANCDVFSVNGR